MAQYEHLPIHKKAYDLTPYFKTENFFKIKQSYHS